MDRQSKPVGLEPAPQPGGRPQSPPYVPPDRPYTMLITYYVEAGNTEGARQLATEYEREVDTGLQRADAWRHRALGQLALATGDTAAAIDHFEAWTTDHPEACSTLCGYFELATTYDAQGQPDSALAWYQRLADAPPGINNLIVERSVLAPTYRRLGELYEARADRENAARYYNEFVELWKDADRELQPQVTEVRQRLGPLVGEGR